MSNKKIDYAQRFYDVVASKGGITLEKYVLSKIPIIFQCSKGHQWKTSPNEIIRGSWCPQCRKHHCDDEFFNRDTEESFYWAGFIAADGCVSNSGSHYSHIQLSSKDISHLEKFKNQIKTTKNIRVFKRKSRVICNHNKPSPELEHCGLQIYSKTVVKSLERFGIVPAKTYKLDIPEWLKTHKLVRHFLRGYIDGDGCFYLSGTEQNPTIFFAMRGTANFLNSFMEIMEDNNIGDKSRKRMEKRYGKKEPMFDCLRYGGNVVIFKMYHFLYDDATVFMERKEEIARKATELVVDGINRKRKSRPRIATKEQLLDMAKQYRSSAKIAKILGCTSKNISWMTKIYGIRDEFTYNIKGYNREEIIKSYEELKNYTAVGKKHKLPITTVWNIVNSH